MWSRSATRRRRKASARHLDHRRSRGVARIGVCGRRGFCEKGGESPRNSAAMGFCLFGNAAIAARHVTSHSRAAIVRVRRASRQWLRFSGRDDGDVLLDPSDAALPGTGAVGKSGEHNTIVNAPLRPGDGGEAFRALRALDFRPELIVRTSAGFDAHMRDPLANLESGRGRLFWATRKIMDIADRSTSGHVVSLLEGGYDLGPRGSPRASSHMPQVMW